MQERAQWMALHLTAQTGNVVTAAQLLGTDKAEKAAEAKAAQKKLERLLKRLRKREAVQTEGVYEEVTDGTDEVRRKRVDHV